LINFKVQIREFENNLRTGNKVQNTQPILLCV
jgi:hypothetical protein